MICKLIHKAQGKWTDKWRVQMREMWALQIVCALVSGEQTNPQNLSKVLNLWLVNVTYLQSEQPFTRSFFHFTSHLSITTLRTDPLSGQ